MKMTLARSRPKIKRSDPLLAVRTGPALSSQPSHVKILPADAEIADLLANEGDEDQKLRFERELVH